jgi:two-component system CAI-1 autoinducer sensor kinase/phosphatase CqsS
MRYLAVKWFQSMATQPWEPILHLSKLRLVCLGVFMIFNNLIFWWIWSTYSPHQYESTFLRLTAAIGAMPLLWLHPGKLTSSRKAQMYVLAYLAFAGPFLHLWLYMQNHGNSIWLSNICLMCVLAYQFSDWRTTTFSIGASLAIVLGVTEMMSLDIQDANDLHVNATTNTSKHWEGWIAFGFSWITALLLGLSAATQRINRVSEILKTMGVMAHELRTPLASAALLTDALSTANPDKVKTIAKRMDIAIKAMHHQIDSQIVNAQLLNLTPGDEKMSAQALVQNAVDSFPFSGERERISVLVVTQRDFVFRGSPRLFTQVVQNLLKNAIFAFKSTGRSLSIGDIVLTVDTDLRTGTISIHDEGPGVPERVRKNIFRPFASTRNNHSSGLGLAFCSNVVRVHSGSIQIVPSKSGTTFLVSLPVDQQASISNSRPAALGPA